jgi:hypothetical protein
MRKFFGFGSSTPPPPPPPSKPPTLASKPAPAPAKPAAAAPAPTPPPPAAPSLVGRWHGTSGSGDGSESTEFHADGTVTERVTGGEAIRGRYLLAGDQLSITLEGMDEPLSFRVVVHADSLEMTDSDGDKSVYRRA